ncbi:MAG: recombination mediator RecR [Christensenellaceae bacterium]|jgi:recombination protein RecR|nr:recombination mediator RecR [Christensenellaceae bacterium]
MSDALVRLIASFRKLPSVGLKTAMRYAYKIVEMSTPEVHEFIAAINEAKNTIHFCKECGNYTELDVCERCQTAEKHTICVVKDPRDISAFEKMGTYNGLYHALHGTLDFQKGITAEQIRVKELIQRLTNVSEVIVATNPDIGGELTAAYLAQLIKPLGIKVTRLAHGIPMGGEVEYADELTLSRALSDRKEM